MPVIPLHPHPVARTPVATEYAEMCARRMAFLQAWRVWIDTRPEPALVEDEHAATARAVAGIVVVG